MHEEIIFAGFGGQGVLFGGQLLAYTALAEGKHVTWIPSYGPEMRGGTANCTVVVSDDPIGSPVCARPSIVVAFNNPSLQKYEDLVMPGGLLIVNSSMIVNQPDRDDITLVMLPATTAATEMGEVKTMNMILMGALLAHAPLVGVEAMKQVLIEKLGERKAHLAEVNMQALARGRELGLAALESA